AVVAIEQAPPLRRRIAQWALAVGRINAEAKRAGRKPPAWARMLLPLADRLVLAKIRDLFGGRVRYFVSGAAPIAVEVLEFFHAAGMLILEGYGCTEICGLSHINRVDDYRFGTVGKPLEGVECRIGDDGEVLLRAPFVFSGYHNLPEETHAAIDEQGWLHTGDIGEVDADGFLRITDRKKNLLKTAGGKYVAPAPIELAIAREDPLIGQVFVEAEGRPYVTALIALDPLEAPPGAFDPSGEVTAETKERLARAVGRANRHLARYERIRRFAVVAGEFRLDRGEVTPTLKLRRHRIRERYGELLDSLYGEAPGGIEPQTE
ncbi:MAG: long-chain fatty acid--CoA ligase, partial [Candidatus Dadabacteria bacterium]